MHSAAAIVLPLPLPRRRALCVRARSSCWEGEPLQFGEMDVEGAPVAPAGGCGSGAAVSTPLAMRQRRRLWSQAETPSSQPALHEPDTDCGVGVGVGELSSLPLQVRLLLSSPLPSLAFSVFLFFARRFSNTRTRIFYWCPVLPLSPSHRLNYKSSVRTACECEREREYVRCRLVAARSGPRRWAPRTGRAAAAASCTRCGARAVR